MLRIIFNKFLFSILFVAFSLNLYSLPAQEIRNSICSPTECYTIVKKLGEGAFGEVFSVVDSNGQKFALKSYKSQHDLGFSDSPLGDVEREFTIGQTLDYPNIIKTYEYFTVLQSNKPISYLVLQYVEGSTLYETEYKKLSKKQAVEASQQLVGALSYVLSMNYIYLDLHQNNLMLTETGDIMIIDLASFFSYDELLGFFNVMNEKKAIVPERPLGNREIKLQNFLLDNPKLVENLQNKNKMMKKNFVTDHEIDVRTSFLVYHFDRIAEICNEIIATSNISREEKTDIRIDVKKVAWNYSDDVKNGIHQPIDYYLDQLFKALENHKSEWVSGLQVCKFSLQTCGPDTSSHRYERAPF